MNTTDALSRSRCRERRLNNSVRVWAGPRQKAAARASLAATAILIPDTAVKHVRQRPVSLRCIRQPLK